MSINGGHTMGRRQSALTNASHLIRHHRLRLGLTLAALGERVGVTAETIRKYESGDIAVSVLQLGKLADALAVPIVALLQDTDSGEQAHGQTL